MNILFCASECVPFAASGGLGDVAGSLPARLNSKGADVRVILPLYARTKEKYIDEMKFVDSFYVSLSWRNQYCGLFTAERNGVTYYFIDNEYYFSREKMYGYFDDGERFAFFSKAILETILHLDFKPDVIHTNDWQTALVCTYLNIYYRHIAKLRNVKTVFTIHNIRYQGQYGLDMAADVLGIPDSWMSHIEWNGDVNFMKSAIEDADIVSTVSPTYAREILGPFHGHGLDGILKYKQYKLWGILNGIDYESYDPKTDGRIARNFHAGAFVRGKGACKEDLRDYFELEKDSSPVISMVTRLVDHKGVDIVRRCADALVDMGYQMVVLGSGDWDYENFFRDLALRHPGRVGVEIGFIPSLARRIYAGSDMFLMPSLSEPCGLSQMIAMRYGTIPIVRRTGGLRDSVSDSLGGKGVGFVFSEYSADDLYKACARAYEGYGDREGWRILTKRAMKQDDSWSRSAERYMEMYEECMKQW